MVICYYTVRKAVTWSSYLSKPPLQGRGTNHHGEHKETVAWAPALALPKTWEPFNLCLIIIFSTIAISYMTKSHLLMERNQNRILCTSAKHPGPVTSHTNCPQRGRSKNRSMIYYPGISLLKHPTTFYEITKG